MRNQSRRFLAPFLLLPTGSVSARAAGAKKFRREAEKVLPAVIRDVSERGGLWVLAADLLVHAADNRFLFERFAPPYEAGALLWVSPVPDGAATRILVGAQNGVFLAPHPPSERWTLIQSGLPSAASEPPLVLENGVVIPRKRVDCTSAPMPASPGRVSIQPRKKEGSPASRPTAAGDSTPAPSAKASCTGRQALATTTEVLI